MRLIGEITFAPYFTVFMAQFIESDAHLSPPESRLFERRIAVLLE